MPISTESEGPKKGGRLRISGEPMLSSGIRTLSRDEVEGKLAAMCDGWSDSIRLMLHIPKEMFGKTSANAEVLSKDSRADAAQFIAFFHRRGALPRAEDLTIVTYETSGNNYLVIYDPGKGILFRDQLSSYHSGSKNNWRKIGELIQSMEGHAGKGEILVYDNVVGSSRTIGN